MRNVSRAFTLIELMLVMAIMGLLGTISIGGFRAMRRGMEQSAVMRNVDQFIHNAYQRAQIDRQPTVVYFWNETRRAESDTESILVVGRAVAVRRAGRVSKFDTGEKLLIDEFGDLRYSAGTDEEGEEESGTSQADDDGAIKMYLYKMNEGCGISDRSEISQTTVNLSKHNSLSLMMTDPDWSQNHSGEDAQIQTYGWKVKDGDWNAGDAYGFEFAELTLPNNYIFGSTFSTDTKDPFKTLSTVIRCKPFNASGTVTVGAIRPGSNGSPEVTAIGTSQSAETGPKQNY